MRQVSGDSWHEENSLCSPSPSSDYAKATATQKAIEVATRLEKDEMVPFMVIGADTVVEAPDGTIMEKPKVGTYHNILMYVQQKTEHHLR